MTAVQRKAACQPSNMHLKHVQPDREELEQQHAEQKANAFSDQVEITLINLYISNRRDKCADCFKARGAKGD